METAVQKKGFDEFTLKMIAVVTMFIDHFGATVVYRILVASGTGVGFAMSGEAWDALIVVYQILRGIGRLAFPIYCYLIVEGLYHTRSVPKYALRLGLFALISEIAFDLAFNGGHGTGKWVEFGYNNVFFTLFVGLVTIYCMKLVNDHTKSERFQKPVFLVAKSIANLAILFAGMLVAEFLLRTDYGGCGVAAIGVMYMLYGRPRLAFAGAVLALGLLGDPLELVALVLVVLIGYCNGERGRQMKYFFYAFYPVHLLLLELLCIALGIG